MMERRNPIHETLQKIENAKAIISGWGRNDAEMSILNDLEHSLLDTAHPVSPDEVSKRIDTMLEKKQDYN